MTLVRTGALCVLLATPSLAFALKSDAHRSLTMDACTDSGFQEAFCMRLTTATVNVDVEEWKELHAHAIPHDGATLCDGARGTLERVHALGQEAHALIQHARGGITEDHGMKLAMTWGRYMHTIQDACSHAGMTDARHAWFSVSDTCLSTRLDPDVQASAKDCAKDQTRIAFESFVDELRSNGMKPADLAVAPTQLEQLPGHDDVCRYWNKASTWDGVENRWEDSVVLPQIQDAFATAQGGSTDAPADPCAKGDDVIRRRTPDPTVDTTGGGAECVMIQAICPDVDDAISVDAPAGCTQSSASPAVMLVVLALLLRRRR